MQKHKSELVDGAKALIDQEPFIQLEQREEYNIKCGNLWQKLEDRLPGKHKRLRTRLCAAASKMN
jgi:hypothetical protein